jgi:hypothetical protein
MRQKERAHSHQATARELINRPDKRLPRSRAISLANGSRSINLGHLRSVSETGRRLLCSSMRTYWRQGPHSQTDGCRLSLVGQRMRRRLHGDAIRRYYRKPPPKSLRRRRTTSQPVANFLFAAEHELLHSRCQSTDGRIALSRCWGNSFPLRADISVRILAHGTDRGPACEGRQTLINGTCKAMPPQHGHVPHASPSVDFRLRRKSATSGAVIGLLK